MSRLSPLDRWLLWFATLAVAACSPAGSNSRDATGAGGGVGSAGMTGSAGTTGDGGVGGGVGAIGGGAGAGGGAAAGTGGAGTGGGSAGTGTAGRGGADAGAGTGGAAAAGRGGGGGAAGGQAGSAGARGGTGGGAGGGGASGGGGAGGGGGGTHAADAAFCAAQLAAASTHYQRFRQAYPTATEIPRSVTAGGVVRQVAVSDWTSGFPAGSYWLLYEATGDAAWRTAAEARTAALQGQATRTDTHDVGFVINNSYGAGYRLTQNTAYRTVMATAAQSLSGRFNASVGAIRSWDFGSWSFPVIIDNMMNLELLYRATASGGSATFRQNAIAHALTTRTNHFRADGSSYHVVDYNPTTGAVIRKQTNQGLADESAWARGQAWGLYGFTMCHRETQDARFLDQAIKIAEFYTKSPVMPADGVPYFDFDAPARSDVPDYRDASAGAIAASGLIELSRYATGEASERYLAFAIKALRSLSVPAAGTAGYRAALGANGHFLLVHSVGNYPISDEVDVGINYADYYYLEALLRCSKL
jgi:hypothetical protein